MLYKKRMQPLHAKPIMKIGQRHGGGFVREADKQGGLLRRAMHRKR